MTNTSMTIKYESKKNNTFILATGMEDVEKELFSNLEDSRKITNTICTKLAKAGGKRIRPLLVLTSSQCFGELKHDTIQASVACELIHMASLVHDDIIDNASTRRNKPSLNSEIGNQYSVLVGDYLFAKAFEIFSKNKLIKPLQIVVEAIAEMCDGEISQENNKFNLNQNIEDYYKRIYKKTGSLIAACCKVGANIAGANKEDTESLETYGMNIGYAYQIIDDILDFTGDKSSIGKPVAKDLKEGNITLPIIKLIEHNEYRTWMEEMTKNKDIKEEQYQEVLRVLHDSYAIQESYKEAEKCIKIAKRSLNRIKDSKHKNILISLADNLLIRDK